MKILLTGMSGVGKTTTLAELQKHGYLVIDSDATGLCKWQNIETRADVHYGLDGRNYEWLTKHGWYCDIDKFKQFLSFIPDDKLVFISGMPENIKEFAKIFDKIFLLDPGRAETEKRLIERTNNHFAKKESERLFMFEHTQELLNQLDAPISKIDTDKKPELVARAILDSLKFHENLSKTIKSGRN